MDATSVVNPAIMRSLEPSVKTAVLVPGGGVVENFSVWLVS